MSPLLSLLCLAALTAAKPLPHAPSRSLVPRACSTANGSALIPATTQLPDPFHFLDSTPAKTKDDFICRQQEISTLMQANELGTKPPKPDQFNATFSGNALTITTGANGKSITFTPTITYPTSGTAPYPAIIGIDGISIPLPPGVATITLNVDDLALQNDQSSRGVGKFYQLYGTDAPAGAMSAWAWGVSRVIDALEMLPNANINPERLGVSGCSRDGKGALVAGALDDRIALTIPQESGSGGAGCWRLSDYELSQGIVTQTASEIVQENVWFGPAFNQFANSSVDVLPFDHHLLASLVAPRGLFVIENSDYVWLGAWPTYGCMKAAHTSYEALGVPHKMGFWELGGHSHCAFPSQQQPALFAFINRFLLDQPNQNTTVFSTDANATSSFTIPGTWANWTVPKLT
ncbi:hypothetical protein MMC10_004713 [Thelotrema lepadinum]|nr:hypothetical protein [Thelotrema lepadinum]